MLRRYVLPIFVCGAALSACNGPSTLSSPGAIPQGLQPAAISGGVATPSPIPFAFQTVDDPASNVNAVTGINQQSEIVGTVGSGSPSSPLESYIAKAPYTSFTSLVYTHAQATVAMGLSSTTNPVVAGYVVKPPTLNGTWAAVLINGLWALFKDNKGIIGSTAATELLGFNDSYYAAGFYINTSGLATPVIVNVQKERFNLLNPPSAISAEATGINDMNHVAGWESTSSGIVGFFYRAGVYYPVVYPSGTTTEALSLNKQDQIVGYYQGSDGIKHGFVMSNPSGQPSWQTIDEPNAVNGTVVTGINANDDICGYYIDGSGAQHGFVAVP